MGPLDSVRYGVAFIVSASHLPSLFLWLAIHPFSSFWRKLGIVWTYVILAIPVAAYIAGVWLLRKPLLGADWGANGITMLLAAVSVAAAMAINHQRRKLLNFKKLSGVPELSREKFPGELLTDGIYGRVRHPRYLEALLWVLGYSLFADYSGPYLVWLVGLPVLYLVILLEERELRQRFGAEYEDYCRRVPRFIPRLGMRKEAE